MKVDALVLELGGLDMVLGVSWLSTLGKVVMDWKVLSMQFMYEDQWVKLKGQGGTQEKQSYLNTFLEDKQRRLGTDWWWSQEEQSKTVIPGDLKGILEQFHEVFREQIQLPPERTQVHQIKLFQDHGTINVRPYRYPHHQKEEIGKQVRELLKVGVIRPSMSV